MPPSDDGQHQGRRDCQNQHPPLVDTVSNANTDAVSNGDIQTYNYARKGPVFNADPFNICRHINSRSQQAQVSICLLAELDLHAYLRQNKW